MQYVSIHVKYECTWCIVCWNVNTVYFVSHCCPLFSLEFDINMQMMDINVWPVLHCTLEILLPQWNVKLGEMKVTFTSSIWVFATSNMIYN